MRLRVCAYARKRVGDKRNAIVVLIALFATACDTPTVPERLLRDVYDFRVHTPAPAVLRWPIGTTVRVFVVADADATRTQWLQAATTHGVSVWNNAALYGEVKLEEVNSATEADVVVEYSAATSPVDASSLMMRLVALRSATSCATVKSRVRPTVGRNWWARRVAWRVTALCS